MHHATDSLKTRDTGPGGWERPKRSHRALDRLAIQIDDHHVRGRMRSYGTPLGLMTTPQHPASRSASLQQSRAPSRQDDLESGFIDLDDLADWLLVTHRLLPSVYEEAVRPESAKYSVRHHPQLTLTACEDAPPLARHGSVGAEGSTGPTFPSFCRQAVLIAVSCSLRIAGT